ncbi:MAG TPA: MarR family transcriptional regulator [Gemmataceae bacterium]|nr:MarR family transcriptional regulator [Gemmataceae bacterium]
MVSSGAGVRLEEVAHNLFDILTRLALLVPRGRRRAGDLKEVEFLTLSILHQHGTMIVGDIQRLLGVLPAQMSRIIRSLETHSRPLISCRINPHDKRKIDVCLTATGEKALQEYEAQRVQGITEVLQKLSEEDLENLSQVLDKLHEALERQIRE